MSARQAMSILPPFGVLLGYLCGAFVSASFNVTTWDIEIRVITVLLMIVFAAAGVGSVAYLNDGPHQRGK